MTAATTWNYVVPAIDAGRMKVLALLLDDPNPIHYDRAAVERLGLGERLVSQGPSTIALVYNLFATHAPDRRVDTLEMSLLRNVREGDRVEVSAVSRGDSGDEFDVSVVTEIGIVMSGQVRLAAASECVP